MRITPKNLTFFVFVAGLLVGWFDQQQESKQVYEIPIKYRMKPIDELARLNPKAAKQVPKTIRVSRNPELILATEKVYQTNTQTRFGDVLNRFFCLDSDGALLTQRVSTINLKELPRLEEELELDSQTGSKAGLKERLLRFSRSQLNGDSSLDTALRAAFVLHHFENDKSGFEHAVDRYIAESEERDSKKALRLFADFPREWIESRPDFIESFKLIGIHGNASGGMLNILRKIEDPIRITELYRARFQYPSQSTTPKSDSASGLLKLNPNSETMEETWPHYVKNPHQRHLKALLKSARQLDRQKTIDWYARIERLTIKELNGNAVSERRKKFLRRQLCETGSENSVELMRTILGDKEMDPYALEGIGRELKLEDGFVLKKAYPDEVFQYVQKVFSTEPTDTPELANDAEVQYRSRLLESLSRVFEGTMNADVSDFIKEKFVKSRKWNELDMLQAVERVGIEVPPERWAKVSIARIGAKNQAQKEDDPALRIARAWHQNGFTKQKALDFLGARLVGVPSSPDEIKLFKLFDDTPHNFLVPAIETSWTGSVRRSYDLGSVDEFVRKLTPIGHEKFKLSGVEVTDDLQLRFVLNGIWHEIQLSGELSTPPRFLGQPNRETERMRGFEDILNTALEEQQIKERFFVFNISGGHELIVFVKPNVAKDMMEMFGLTPQSEIQKHLNHR